MQAIETFWYSCLKHFENALNAQQFNTWIKPLQLDLSQCDDNSPVLIAPNRFVLQWVKENFIPHIEVMAQQHFAREIHFQLILGNSVEAKTINGENNIRNMSEQAIPAVSVKPASKKKNVSQLNPNFTFDSFVTGKANQLARAGAIQVAERPGIA